MGRAAVITTGEATVVLRETAPLPPYETGVAPGDFKIVIAKSPRPRQDYISLPASFTVLRLRHFYLLRPVQSVSRPYPLDEMIPQALAG